MKAERDKKTGKWLIQFRYTYWQGVRRKTTKRGFATKREAEEYVRNFLASQQADFNMNFQEFLKLYYEDMAPRLRENTMRNKKYIIDLKILPYFASKSMNKITAADIRKWQNELISKGHSQTYLRTINNQLTAVFNYAVRYYDLQNNPCRKAGGIGKNKADEMKFWTKDEFYVRATRIEIPASITATEFYRKFGYDYKNVVKELDEEHHYRLEKFKEAGQ